MSLLQKGNQKSSAHKTWAGALHPLVAKQLSEEGFDFKTLSFPERKPIETGRDYTIPGPDYAYEDVEARQAKLAETAKVPKSLLPLSTVAYYDKSFIANLKANTPFMATSKKSALPVKSGTAYQMFQYPASGGSKSE